MEFPSQIRRLPQIRATVPRSLGSSNTAAKRTPRSARCLTYNTPQTHQHNACSFYSQPRGSRPALHQLSMNEVFVPESPEHNTWQPGQQLPLPPQHPWQCSEQDHSSTSDAGGELYTVLQSMQSSIESGFQDIKGRLTQLEGRMEKMEEKHKQYDLLQVSPTSSTESSSSGERGRKRRSPPQLQYEIRRVHSAFMEENQLKAEERIDSQHNKTVVRKIVQEIGTTNFTKRQIENGVKIYCKSLRDCTKPRSDAVVQKVRVRSRQQRIFERRSKMVKAREAKSWKLVSPDMMSEEEAEGDDFVRHRPGWRSATLNRFFEKLENRYKSKHEKTLAKPRRYGNPIQREAPPGIPSWMLDTAESLLTTEDEEPAPIQSDKELFSDRETSSTEDD